MKNKWLLLLVVAGLLVVGLMPFSSYGKSSYFGVKNQAIGVPPEFDQTDKCINDAEQSSGARYCPDKIAQAKELAKQGVEAYWKCNTAGGLAMLAQACKLANDARGCGPVAARQPAAARTPIEFHSVYFDFDKSDLRPDAKEELDKAAKTMLANPDVVLQLAGNTDSVGSEKYNQALGDRRAKAVFDYLRAKGIAANRLEQVSYGKDRPVATNSTDEGRAKNRHVGITILK